MEFYVICGPDGSGKNTQIDLLSKRLDQNKIKHQLLAIWDSCELFYPELSREKATIQIGKILGQVGAQTRSHFLISAICENVRKIKTSNQMTLVNSYYYKYWASEVSIADVDNLWQNSCSVFPKPKSIFYLDIPADETLKRKKYLSPYESGFSNDSAATLKHLNIMNTKLNSLIKSENNVIFIDGLKSPQKIHEEIWNVISKM